MSTEWTAERLDALPEGTLIDVEWSSYIERLAKPAPGKWWAVNLGDRPDQCDTSSEDLADNPNVKSIRLVSVPIEALLSEGTVIASSWFIRHPAARVLARSVLDAAVGYVTGDPD